MFLRSVHFLFRRIFTYFQKEKVEVVRVGVCNFKILNCVQGNYTFSQSEFSKLNKVSNYKFKGSLEFIIQKLYVRVKAREWRLYARYSPRATPSESIWGKNLHPRALTHTYIDAEPTLALSEGFNLLISRLSHSKSSDSKVQEESILKSSRETGWPVVWWWERMLVGGGLVRLLPVSAEIPNSSISSHSYRIAKFRVSLLHQFSNKCYSINNTFSFVNKLLGLYL